jgi:hypothetical protein
MAQANDRAQKEFGEALADEVYGKVVEYDSFMQETTIQSNVSEREFIRAALDLAEDFVDDPDEYYDVRIVEESYGYYSVSLLV